MYLKTLDKYECCGCTACANACAKKAITMETDSEGFKYPVINKELCIDCGLCEKVCAFANPQYVNTDSPKVYAAYHINVDERKKSSSGGIFYSIAQWVIAHKGVVYGAAFDEELQLRHISAESEEQLQKLRGSKYLQSDLVDIYLKVRENLMNGRWCYFVGTGCQVAGLKAFLRKEYPTLITSDLVCHGTPSQKLFNKHIEYLNKKTKRKIINYQFRKNDGWGVNEIYKYKKMQNKIEVINTGHFALSPYLYQFMYAYSYRYSCYDCKFAQIPRQGDITLADYWGVKDFFPQIDTSKGVSLILVNNEQGNIIWKEIKSNCKFYESRVEDGAKYNGNLVKHTKEPEIRKGIYDRIDLEGYDKIAKILFRPNNYRKIQIKQLVTRSYFYKIVRRILNK